MKYAILFLALISLTIFGGCSTDTKHDTTITKPADSVQEVPVDEFDLTTDLDEESGLVDEELDELDNSVDIEEILNEI